MLRLNLAAVLCLAVVCSTSALVAQPVHASLQSAVTEAMASEHGAAVVLDVHSGALVASSNLDVAARRAVAPGSAIKPFTLKALLESRTVTAQTALVCKRSVSIAGRKLDCSHPRTTEPLDPEQALAYSCNSYFTTVALRLSPEELQSSLLREGFGSTTGLVHDEASGTVARAQSPEQVQLQAIGEWGIRVTPLQMVEAYRKLGQLQQTHEAKLQPLFAGLEQSVMYGMGRMAQPDSAMKVAGKTGTAPAEEGAWTHAWFAGYAPAHDPQVVLVVFLEKGHGGSEAASVARKIFEAYARMKHAPPMEGDE